MTTQKDFKRVVRARMAKTGESYTSARANLVLEPSIKPSSRQAVKPDFAKLAGMTDAAVKKATGCTWERWVWTLDKVDAHTWPHRAIVEYAHEKYRTPDWWAQMVVVGYERIKGLRVVGQNRGGTFRAAKSKVVAVPLARLYRAFHDPRSRARWLPGVKFTIRTAMRDKSMRVTWPDGTSVAIGFIGKGAGKSQVALEHSKLADQADVQRRKAFWTERLAALGEVLTQSARRKTA